MVPLNTIFGVGRGVAIARYEFKGKTLLTSFIDLPFAVSPVVAGLIFVLLLGVRSPAGHLLSDWGIKIIFSTPGIVLATIFVTFPFVARELIPVLQAKGSEAEEAALTLGAAGWQTFWRVTLPSLKWALIYGVVLCNARAIGEFGAVSVVSGHIRGKTNTIPLHVEILYNEYNFAPPSRWRPSSCSWPHHLSLKPERARVRPNFPQSTHEHRSQECHQKLRRVHRLKTSTSRSTRANWSPFWVHRGAAKRHCCASSRA